MSNTLPISPMQARARRVTILPTDVIESFNELIVENLDADGKSATIGQKEVVARILSKMNGPLNQPFKANYTTQDVYDKGWLNIEDVYRQAGWKVTYDKPGFNESYEPTFEFTGKKWKVK